MSKQRCQYSAEFKFKVALARYFQFYNHDRPHQGLHSRTPAEVHLA